MIPRLSRRWAALPVLLAVLGHALGQGVAPRAELCGDWIGAIRLPNETVTIFLHVRVDGERTRATLKIPDVRTIEFERVVLEAPAFRLLDSETLPLGIEGKLEEGRLQGRCDLAGGLAGEFALVPIESGGEDERYEDLSRRGFLGPLGMIFVARGHAARGEVERAFTWLARAREMQLNVKALFQAPEFEATGSRSAR